MLALFASALMVVLLVLWLVGNYVDLDHAVLWKPFHCVADSCWVLVFLEILGVDLVDFREIPHVG
jgi:hypothetical protein